jgi:hypothetical protein
MLIINLTAEEIATLNELLPQGSTSANKIGAIKHVRAASRHQRATNPNAVAAHPTVPRTFSDIGLAEAKDAVEVWMAEHGILGGDGLPQVAPPAPRARIAPFQPIRRIVCNFGEGEVELDMEAMSLRVLTGLNGSVRIGDALALVDLYKRVKDWEEELTQGCKPPGSVV